MTYDDAEVSSAIHRYFESQWEEPLHQTRIVANTVLDPSPHIEYLALCVSKYGCVAINDCDAATFPWHSDLESHEHIDPGRDGHGDTHDVITLIFLGF